jgi:hypothetical protein
MLSISASVIEDPKLNAVFVAEQPQAHGTTTRFIALLRSTCGPFKCGDIPRIARDQDVPVWDRDDWVPQTRKRMKDMPKQETGGIVAVRPSAHVDARSDLLEIRRRYVQQIVFGALPRKLDGDVATVENVGGDVANGLRLVQPEHPDQITGQRVDRGRSNAAVLLYPSLMDKSGADQWAQGGEELRIGKGRLPIGALQLGQKKLHRAFDNTF